MGLLCLPLKVWYNRVMETISGGPSDETRDFKPNAILESAKLNKALENWVVTEVPDDSVGEIGDVVFVTGPGDGGSSSSVGGGGLVHLHTQEFSNVGSVSVDNVFDATYKNYRIVFSGILTSNEANLTSRLRLNRTEADAANYFYLQFAKGLNQSDYEQAGRGETSITLGRIGASGTSSCSVDLFSPALSARTTFQSQNYGNGTSTGFIQSGGGTHSLTNAYDGITIATAASDMTGSISIYGYSEGVK